MQKDPLAVIGLSFLGPESEKRRYGTYDCKPDGSWSRTAEKNVAELRRIWSCDIPLYRAAIHLGKDYRTISGTLWDNYLVESTDL